MGLVYNATTGKVEYLVELDGGSGYEPIIINLTYMQDTTPSNPQEKDVWYNTSNDELYTYKNGQWIESDPSVGVWYKFGNQYYLWDGDSLEVTDLNIYEKIENKTDDYTEVSAIKYPSSKALSDGLAAVSSIPTINYFEGTTGTTLDTQLTLGNSVLVFKNGVLLQLTEDYTISGSTITFVTALVNTDKIAVINGNLSAIDLTLYVVKPTIVTNGDNTGLAVAGNTIYKFGTVLTSLTISSVEISDYESIIHFTTGAGTIQFTAPNTLRWGGGNEMPQLEPNTVYCIAIRNGLAEIDNFGSAS